MIKEEAQKEEHKESDMFIFTVMSHGTKDYIYAQDGNPKLIPDPNSFAGRDEGKLHITQDILMPFSTANSPNLAGKPKVFFIQACQGSKFQNKKVYIENI